MIGFIEVVYILLAASFYLTHINCQENLEQFFTQDLDYYLEHQEHADDNLLLDHIIYIYLHNIFKPIYYILLEFLPIINAVLITRAVHLLIDFIGSNKNRLKTTLKNVVTSAFGFYLINERNDKTLILTTLIVYMAFLQLHIFRDVATKSLIRLYIFSALIALGPILFNEYSIYIDRIQENVKLRSVLMTMAMKFMTLVVNAATNSLPKAKPQSSTLNVSLHHLAYFVHPASCLVGLWHPVEIQEEKHTFSRQLKKFLASITQAVLILAVSQILAELLDYIMEVQEYPAEPVPVFLAAMEFRYSHYFMCFLTLSLIALFTTDYNRETCKISAIEFPRSLVQVVIYWNIPMHTWLKSYVFQPFRKETGKIGLAILTTYFLSSLLHGFKFHIWSVLLTLGYLTWVEHKLRARLARKLSACVLSHRCDYIEEKHCKLGHKRTWYNSYLTKGINICFSLLAMMHLAYLGCIFRKNSDEASFKDALTLWSQLYFYSHILAVIFHCILISLND